MKRYPEFIYNAIANQSIVYTNQLKMSDWNNIINVLRTQTNANTTFLETWTRWFFGPKEYIDEDEYAIVPDGYTNYFDYLTGMFTEIDTRIKNEIDDRTAADTELREYTDLKHGIAMNTIAEETQQRKSKDNEIVSRVGTVENITSNHTSILSEISEDISDHNAILQQHTDEIDEHYTKIEEHEDAIGILSESNLRIDLSNVDGVKGAVAEGDIILIKDSRGTYTISVSAFIRDVIQERATHYKGDYLSYEALVDTHPIAKSGDYAFVNYTQEDGTDKLIMYIWDDNSSSEGTDNPIPSCWRETTSQQYVTLSMYDDLNDQLNSGNFVVGAAKNAEYSQYAKNSSYYTDPTVPGASPVDIKSIMPSPLSIELHSEFSEGLDAGVVKEIIIGNDIWRIPNDTTSIQFSSVNTTEDAYDLCEIIINNEHWRINNSKSLQYKAGDGISISEDGTISLNLSDIEGGSIASKDYVNNAIGRKLEEDY